MSVREFVGIDTGFSGAIAILTEDGKVLSLLDMPIIEDKDKSYDLTAICNLIESIQIKNVTFCLEKTYPRSKYIGGTGKANWWLGAGFNLWLGILHAFRCKYEIVDPRVWSRYFFKGRKNANKEASYVVASGLFRGQELSRINNRKRRVVYDGRCDALLIAEYMRRRMIGEK